MVHICWHTYLPECMFVNNIHVLHACAYNTGMRMSCSCIVIQCSPQPLSEEWAPKPEFRVFPDVVRGMRLGKNMLSSMKPPLSHTRENTVIT